MTTLGRLVDANRMTELPSEYHRYRVGGSGGDGVPLYDDHHNKRVRSQGLQNRRHIALHRGAESPDLPHLGRQGHAQMTSLDCMDSLVRSTADILLLEYPTAFQESQRQTAVIDFAVHEESTIGQSEHCVGFGDWV